MSLLFLNNNNDIRPLSWERGPLGFLGSFLSAWIVNCATVRQMTHAASTTLAGHTAVGSDSPPAGGDPQADLRDDHSGQFRCAGPRLKPYELRLGALPTELADGRTLSEDESC